MPEPTTKAPDFVREIVDADRAAGKHGGRVATRFPPEPNGYLHIGHAKSICLNFGIAEGAGGTCNLRFDDTNPEAEDVEYVESIKEDVRWLGFEWAGPDRYASDYFGRLYEWAEKLVAEGKAYVDDSTEDQIRDHRGNYYIEGRPSPFRDRPTAESLDLLRRMKAGEFADGTRVLRARIEVTSPNMNMRDPLMYRIRHARHHRTGDAWCIYPMYDWAHGQSDAIESITHSICTLEFENHRPLYDWFLAAVGIPAATAPRQIEFARLNLTYTVMSKRRLLQLVEQKRVSGWDDPRMPTIAGMRRRGYTPEAIRSFCDRIGVAKNDSVIDIDLLEHCVREDLEARAPRVMGVLRPLRLVIENYPEGQVDELDCPLHPDDPSMGTRKVPLARVLYVDRDDFREDPPKKWFRLAPGREVRLRYACLVTCTRVVKDERTGEVTELRCAWDPASRGGSSPDGRKVKGTIHWVSAEHSVPAEVRLYDRLFAAENPMAAAGEDFASTLNPGSLEVLSTARVERHLATAAAPGTRWQFERLGWFFVDPSDSRGAPAAEPGAGLVFNRTVQLRDSWAKIEKKQGGE